MRDKTLLYNDRYRRRDLNRRPNFVDRHVKVAVFSGATFILITVTAIILFIHVLTYDPLPKDLPRFVVHIYGAPVHAESRIQNGASGKSKRGLINRFYVGKRQDSTNTTVHTVPVVGDRGTSETIQSLMSGSIIPDAIYLDVDVPTGRNETAFQRTSFDQIAANPHLTPAINRMHHGKKMVDLNLIWSGRHLHGTSSRLISPMVYEGDPDTIILSVNSGVIDPVEAGHPTLQASPTAASSSANPKSSSTLSPNPRHLVETSKTSSSQDTSGRVGHLPPPPSHT
ncbi:hypothetical protein HDU97_009257 [Phlyctochytrium planicorne]|nr:hypothetical protein HDU97_009257 [Phlyctochytrium planicorne]